MKHLVFTLLAALVFSGAASAQRLIVGVRGGVNFADYSFVPTRIGDTRFTPGAVRAGYDVGFVLRLNLSKHLHLQSELNYAFVNYNVLAENSGNRRIALRTERFEIPVQLGFQFGVLRLCGGTLVEAWGLELPADTGHTLRYMPPETTDNTVLWVRTDAGWQQADTSVDGSYLTCTAPAGTTAFAAVQMPASKVPLLAAACGAAAALLLVILFIARKKKKKKAAAKKTA